MPDLDFGQLTNDDRPLRVVGNLPYNIPPLIFKLLDNTTLIRDMYFMLQREVVLRLAAEPGSKDWGRQRSWPNSTARSATSSTYPGGAFFPAPKVQSAIVRLLPHSSAPSRLMSPNWAGWYSATQDPAQQLQRHLW